MDKNNGLMPLGDILKQAIPKPQRPRFAAAVKALKPLSRVQNRLLEPCPEHEPEICFQHTVLCQTGLPYRDPGDDVRLWKRKQGNAALRIEAGAVRLLQSESDGAPRRVIPRRPECCLVPSR